LYKGIEDPITHVLATAGNHEMDFNEIEKRIIQTIEKERDQKEMVEVSHEREKGAEFEYDIVFSFAGEDRAIVKRIADALVSKGIKVFYDGYHKSDMWGKSLIEYFQGVYGPKVRYAIILISRNYPVKDWTDFELSVAKKEAKKKRIRVYITC
jgi:hypothetical protein